MAKLEVKYVIEDRECRVVENFENTQILMTTDNCTCFIVNTKTKEVIGSVENINVEKLEYTRG